MSDLTHMSSHYNANYFDWQEGLGAFGGWADLHKFSRSISPKDVVLDFGCGGGFLLRNLSCKRRIGIEPNQSAASTLKANGIEHFLNSADALHELGQGAVDVIISNHALEHTLDPLSELKRLLPLLRSGGVAHFVVPCEAISTLYMENDINHHLFTWCPQNLGNLFTEAGYKVEFSRPYIHKWPPYFKEIAKLGWPIFNVACRLWGRIERRSFQVELRAVKPAS